MSLTVPELWNLLEKSRLLSEPACADLRRRWSQVKGAAQAKSARTLAEWLIAEERITTYQAKLLLAGQPGPFFYGDYLLQKRLRRGGLRDCYQAVHVPTRFPVTLRFVRGTDFEPTTDAGQVDRLFEGAPRKPGTILSFQDWVDCGAYQFGVFDRAEGTPAADILELKGKLEPAVACAIVYDAATALAALHRRGLAHGAVRTNTVWLAEGRRAILLPPQLSESWEALRGKRPWLAGGDDPRAIAIAHFVAPETARRSAPLTPAADVYALGCLLFALLAGKPPFTGSSVEEILQQHATEAVPRLPRRKVPSAIDRVLTQLLTKDVAQRLATAEQVADALRPLAAPAGTSRHVAESSDSGEAVRRRKAYQAWLVQRSARRSGEPRDQLPIAVLADMTGPPVSAATATAIPAAWSGVSASTGGLPPTETSVAARLRQKRRSDWATMGAVVALAVITALGAAFLGGRGGSGARSQEGLRKNGEENRPTPGGSNGSDRRSPQENGVLWASPTAGVPISAAYLPPGTQGILSIRLADLLAHPEGERTVAAVGPQVQGLLERLPAATGFGASEISRLTAGWRTGGPLGWGNVTLVVHVRGDVEISYEELSNRLTLTDTSDNGRTELQGQPVLERGAAAFWLPSQEGGRVLVVTAVEEMPLVVQQGPEPPPLAREMEQLLATSDADRHVSVLLPPRVLLGDGRELLAHHAAELRELLQWFVGEKTEAVSFSMHWDRNFFVEMQAVAIAEVTPLALQRDLEERLAGVPARVAGHLQNVGITPFAGPVLARLPEMLKALVRYTRSEADADSAVLRCYLPLPAGHNLLMAGEIALAETYAGVSDRSAPAPIAASSIETRLAQVTSLVFSNDTLETALEMLAADIDVPIEILGRDLQREGITRNQSLAIDMRDRPAREILVEILRRANPDKAATTAADPRQSLVFTIRPGETGEEAVTITTRRAARERGITLPGEFRDAR